MFQYCVKLEHPDVTQDYIIRCDASGVSIAGILSQIDEKGEERII